MTNAAAIGYMIIAARRLQLDPEIIAHLVTVMCYAMDEITEGEAEFVYQNT